MLQWIVLIMVYIYVKFESLLIRSAMDLNATDKLRVRCKSLAPNRCQIDKLLTVNSPVAALPCVTLVVFIT